MKFTKTNTGRYYATEGEYTYTVVNTSMRGVRRWTLTVRNRETLTTAFQTDTDAKSVACAVAEQYAALAPGYRSSEHGHMEIGTVAVIRAYRAEVSA